MTPDEPSEDLSVEWLERDLRDWVLFANQPDQLTARMTCIYLETGGIEARVATLAGQYCVEVPASQVEAAHGVYSPVESGVAPPMQEETRKTGIHTGKHLRDSLLPQGEPQEMAPRKLSIGTWLLRLVVLAILITLILLILGD